MGFRGQCCQQGRKSRMGRFSQLQAELEVRASVLDLSQHPDRSVLQNKKKKTLHVQPLAVSRGVTIPTDWQLVKEKGTSLSLPFTGN